MAEAEKDKRDMVAQEIHDTEMSYVNSMKDLLADYVVPLATRPDILSQKQHAMLFSNTEIIVPLNEKFLVDLKERIGSWYETPKEQRKMGDIFRRMAPFFKMYSDYANNYEHSANLLAKLLDSNSKFQAFMKGELQIHGVGSVPDVKKAQEEKRQDKKEDEDSRVGEEEDAGEKKKKKPPPPSEPYPEEPEADKDQIPSRENSGKEIALPEGAIDFGDLPIAVPPSPRRLSGGSLQSSSSFSSASLSSPASLPSAPPRRGSSIPANLAPPPPSVSSASAADSPPTLLVTRSKERPRYIKPQKNKIQELPSLLIMPIQRIPRYQLLLTELLKRTPEEHADYADLNKALEEVKKVAKHVNETVRAGENRNMILQIEAQFKTNPEFVSPSRFFIHSGNIKKKGRGGDRSYTFHLFNDLLAYSEVGVGSKLKLHRKVPIDKAFLVIDELPETNHKDHYFKVTVQNSQKSFVLYFPSADDKKKWLAAFHQVIEIRDKSIRRDDPVFVAPTLEEYDASPECPLCHQMFSIFRRRHGCSHCGLNVCKECSTNKMILVGKRGKHGEKDGRLHRVCDKCFQILVPTAKKVAEEEGKAVWQQEDAGGGEEVEYDASGNIVYKPSNWAKKKKDQHKHGEEDPLTPMSLTRAASGDPDPSSSPLSPLSPITIKEKPKVGDISSISSEMFKDAGPPEPLSPKPKIPPKPAAKPVIPPKAAKPVLPPKPGGGAGAAPSSPSLSPARLSPSSPITPSPSSSPPLAPLAIPGSLAPPLPRKHKGDGKDEAPPKEEPKEKWYNKKVAMSPVVDAAPAHTSVRPDRSPSDPPQPIIDVSVAGLPVSPIKAAAKKEPVMDHDHLSASGNGLPKRPRSLSSGAAGPMAPRAGGIGVAPVSGGVDASPSPSSSSSSSSSSSRIRSPVSSPHAALPPLKVSKPPAGPPPGRSPLPGDSAPADDKKVDLEKTWTRFTQDSSPDNWFLLGFPGGKMQFVGTGKGGLAELKKKLDDNEAFFGAVKVIGTEEEKKRTKFIALQFIGSGVGGVSKGKVMGAKQQISELMRGVNVTAECLSQSQVTHEFLATQLIRANVGARPSSIDFGDKTISCAGL